MGESPPYVQKYSDIFYVWWLQVFRGLLIQHPREIVKAFPSSLSYSAFEELVDGLNRQGLIVKVGSKMLKNKKQQQLVGKDDGKDQGKCIKKSKAI